MEYSKFKISVDKKTSNMEVSNINNFKNNNLTGPLNQHSYSDNVRNNLNREIESMDFDEEYITKHPSVLFEENTTNKSDELIKPIEVSINELFYDVLSNNIASNMYDAVSGNFIKRERLNDKLWLDKELTFEEKSNGAYLISIIDEFGNKVYMGFTDANTYNKYMEIKEHGKVPENFETNNEEITIQNTEIENNIIEDDNLNNTENINISSIEYINNESNINTDNNNNNDLNVKDEDITISNVDINSIVDYKERYSISNSYSGNSKFNLTTDNNTFTMSDEEVAEIAAIVYGEAREGSPDDALAVASVMANRVDSDRNWGGADNGLIGVAHAKGQFAAYLDQVPKYLNFKEAYQNGTLNEGMQICLEAVRDVMNGVRNNDYESFRSWGSSNYSDNYIIERGNRYS